ncbi:DNRLRE domain-containing protein [bacterium]|nr:DNRLRE domain-containing protein [bacterium]
MKRLYCNLVVLGIAFFFLSSDGYASVITLQPGSEGKDTIVYSGSPNNNYGSGLSMDAGNINSFYPLIEFDISVLPEDVIIYNAVLELYVRAVNSVHYPMSAYKIVSPWDEMTVTWNNKPSLDMSAGVLNSGGIPAQYTWAEWDITDFVNEWHSGISPNYGVGVVSMTNYSQAYLFWTSDYSTDTLRPKLTITYDAQAVPEPTTLLLVGLALFSFVHRRLHG